MTDTDTPPIATGADLFAIDVAKAEYRSALLLPVLHDLHASHPRWAEADQARWDRLIAEFGWLEFFTATYGDVPEPPTPART